MEAIEDTDLADGATEQHESASFDDFMRDVQGQVQDLIKQHYKPPETNWEALQAFGHAINWGEPFIQGVVAFHLILLTTAVATRKNITAQFSIFCFVALSVFMAERLNALGAEHWEQFASQNYFDRSGIFCSLFLSAPFLFIAFCQLVNLLLLVSSDLIQAKRLQLQRKAQANRQAAQHAGEAPNAEASTNNTSTTSTS